MPIDGAHRSQVAGRVSRLKSSYFLGIDTEVRGNVHFVDENTVFYPIGRVLLFHDLKTDHQRYMKVPETSKVISRIAMSPNRMFVAVVEEEGNPTISVYNLETRCRVIMLGNPLPHSSLDTFGQVSFTCDSEYIVAVTEGVDPTMIYYRINGHVESYASAVGDLCPPGVSVTAIACHPTDRTILCIVGYGLFRFISWTDGSWVQYGFNNAKKLQITGVCWITNEMVLVGTKCGRLIAIEYGDVRGVYLAKTVMEIHLVKNTAGEYRIDLQDGKIPKGFKNGVCQVNGLTSFSRGFAYSYSKAMIVFFERTDANSWAKRNVVFAVEPPKVILHQQIDDIRFISTSPSGNKLACTSGRREVYIADITEPNDQGWTVCTKVLSGFHFGRIVGIATCQWKPVLMTVGKDDNTCRFWNFKTKKLLFSQCFPDDKIYGCAFHPTGWYCLLGFKHQLKMFMVMVDELKSIRLFRIKTCNLMCFSQQGHMFAAGNTSRRTIEVYCCVSFETIWVFKCYNNPVTALYFGCNDCILYTTDPDGSVNFWDLQIGEDVNTRIYLDTANYDVATTKHGIVYFVGDDGSLKEIKNDFLRSYKLDQKILYSVAIGHAEECMFVAGESKSILSIEFPITEPFLFQEVKMHSWPIKKLLIADNDSTLISIDQSGIVGVWRITVPRDKRPSKLENVLEISEVAVNAKKLAEEDETIIKQQLNIDRKKFQHNYILQHLEEVKMKEIVTLTNKFIHQIENLQKMIKTNDKDHSSKTSELQQAFEKMQKYYLAELEKQSKEFESELMQEYLKGDSIKGRIVVFVWDMRRFVKTAKAATRQIFELYNSFVNTKVGEIKAEIVDLRMKKKCLLQKFSRETYNFEKYLNDCMDEYMFYHQRRSTKLGIRREYLKDEILFLIKKSSSLDDKIQTFYNSGMRVFKHLDEMRQDSRTLKTKNKALQLTLEAIEVQAKRKEGLILSLKKAMKSDVNQQMEKNERFENTKFTLKPLIAAELRDLRNKQESLVDALAHQRSKLAFVTLCIATVEKLNRELLKKKAQSVANDFQSMKFIAGVKEDLTDVNKISDNRVMLKKALLELYKKYINPLATMMSVGEDCDDFGLPQRSTHHKSTSWDSLEEKTGLEEVVESYQLELMLKKGEDFLRREIAVMRKSLPSRPRLLVGHKYKTFSSLRMTTIMKQVNNYRYRLGEALDLLAAEDKSSVCVCDDHT